MKIFFLIMLMISSILSFGQSAKMYKQSFDRFIELDSSNIVLIPIDWGNNAKIGEIKIMGNRRTKNIFFYDPTNDYQKLLFQESQQIIVNYSGQLLHRSYKLDTIKHLNRDHLYYSVIKDDYNGDKKLDSDDPKYLYYSKIDGTDLTLLTPKYYHLKYYKYIKSSNVILATLISDENQDRKFNNKDSEVLYKIDLNDFSKSKIITKLKLKGEME
ncbi:MAG: hypothetical protein ABFS35_13940 [Bacteroidota bacterium]